MFLDQFLFELLCKNTQGNTYRHTRTHTHKIHTEKNLQVSKEKALKKSNLIKWKGVCLIFFLFPLCNSRTRFFV